MRVVITGGAGFVGSHLCTGALQNLDDASENPRLTFKRADACLPLPVRGKVDAVLHDPNFIAQRSAQSAADA